MSQKYAPPKQGWFGQIFDSLFILALVYLSLLLPLLFKAKAAETAAAKVVAAPTWASLNLSPIVQQQWEKLGYNAEKAAGLINTKFDYSIDPMWLGITAVVIIGYFFLMIKVSTKQYREVIAEKFDS